MKFCTVFLMCIALTLGRVVKQNDKVENQVNQLSVKNDPGIVNTNLRCHGTNDGCCTADNPCMEGDGDCDSDYQCAGDLVCGDNNCAFSNDGDDCCMQQKVERPDALCPVVASNGHVLQYGNFVMGGDGHGAYGYEEYVGIMANDAECVAQCIVRRKSDKSVSGVTIHTPSRECYCEHNMYTIKTWGKSAYKTCYLPKYADIVVTDPYKAFQGGWLGLRCYGHEDHCCTEKKPCMENQGDCDHDDQCYEPGKDLVCGNANCAWGKHGDCCMKRHVGGDQVAEKPLLEEVKDEAPKFAPEEMTDAFV